MKYEKEIRKIITAIINVTEPIKEIGLEENLQNIGMDSIKLVELIVETENHFEMEFPYEKMIMAEAGTIKKICDIVIAVKGEEYYAGR